MIVRSGQPFTLRDLFDRFGLISIQRRVGRYCRPRLNPRRHTFAAIGGWSLVSDLAGRSAVRQRDRRERFDRFGPECSEDTAKEGFDDRGGGWYAAIPRSRRCGRRGMRVGPLAQPPPPLDFRARRRREAFPPPGRRGVAPNPGPLAGPAQFG